VSECLGRVFINALIAAGYARLLCGYVTTSTQYWYFWLQLSKKQQLTKLRCTTNARGGCGGLSQGVTTMKSKLGAAFPTALRPRDRRTEPARQRTYIRLHGRVDRLEDAISHFYNVINELRRRVSTLEKKLKPLNGGGGERRSPEL
jgi:hypothetical protein